MVSEKKHKKSMKKGGEKESKPVDNFYRLSRNALVLMEGLTFFADQTMIPETKDETIYAKMVVDNGFNIIIQYARLGIDIEAVVETFYKEYYDGKERPENNLKIDTKYNQYCTYPLVKNDEATPVYKLSDIIGENGSFN